MCFYYFNNLDVSNPRRLGPKRANKIRKLFALTKDDDVRKYVVRRKITREGKKDNEKAPKIQRLITPQSLQRKRREVAAKRNRASKQRDLKEQYQVLLVSSQSSRCYFLFFFVSVAKPLTIRLNAQRKRQKLGLLLMNAVAFHPPENQRVKHK